MLILPNILPCRNSSWYFLRLECTDGRRILQLCRFWVGLMLTVCKQTYRLRIQCNFLDLSRKLWPHPNSKNLIARISSSWNRNRQTTHKKRSVSIYIVKQKADWNVLEHAELNRILIPILCCVISTASKHFGPKYSLWNTNILLSINRPHALLPSKPVPETWAELWKSRLFKTFQTKITDSIKVNPGTFPTALRGDLSWQLYVTSVRFTHLFFPLNCHYWQKLALVILQLHI